jgi:hypothetical protein
MMSRFNIHSPPGESRWESRCGRDLAVTGRPSGGRAERTGHGASGVPPAS